MNLPCKKCGKIPDQMTAATGRDEGFPVPMNMLKSYELRGSPEFYTCPTCKAMFVWEEDSSMFGSGCNDSQTLTRLNEKSAEALREVLALRDKKVVRDAEALVRRLFDVVAFPEWANRAVDSLLYAAAPETVDSIVPVLVGRLYREDDRGFSDFLEYHCRTSRARAELLCRLLAEDSREKPFWTQHLVARMAKYLRAMDAAQT